MAIIGISFFSCFIFSSLMISYLWVSFPASLSLLLIKEQPFSFLEVKKHNKHGRWGSQNNKNYQKIGCRLLACSLLLLSYFIFIGHIEVLLGVCTVGYPCLSSWFCILRFICNWFISQYEHDPSWKNSRQLHCLL